MAAILSLNKDTGLYWLLASIWRHHLIWAHGLIIRPIPTHYDTHLKNLTKSTLLEEGLRLETASLQNRRSFWRFWGERRQVQGKHEVQVTHKGGAKRNIFKEFCVLKQRSIVK